MSQHRNFSSKNKLGDGADRVWRIVDRPLPMVHGRIAERFILRKNSTYNSIRIKMNKEKLGFGIIGTGAIASHHAAAITAYEGSKLVAVCSSTESRAEQAREKFGVRAYYKLEEFLAN